MNEVTVNFKIKHTITDGAAVTPTECLELLKWFNEIASKDARSTLLATAKALATGGRLS